MSEPEIDFERVREIMSKLADLLEDAGFSTPRQEMEAPGPLRTALCAPRNRADMAIVEHYIRDLALDIQDEVSINPTDDVLRAQQIVKQAVVALGKCAE